MQNDLSLGAITVSAPMLGFVKNEDPKMKTKPLCSKTKTHWSSLSDVTLSSPGILDKFFQQTFFCYTHFLIPFVTFYYH